MTLKQLLIAISIATAICWIAWGTVVIQIDPSQAPGTAFLVFYATLFCALLGSFFLASFAWRRFLSKTAMDYKLVSVSFRQSIFFALIIVGILFLQSRDLLTWWNIILIILAITVIEALFLSLRRQR